MYHADFAKPHDCKGQAWTEAIAVLNVASAELRLEAAKLGRAHSPGNAYSDEMKPYDDLMQRAETLDKLASWLRRNMTLPESDPG